MRKHLYLIAALAALGVQSANAQTYYYDVDSSFSAVGIKYLNYPSAHVLPKSCLLLNDGKSYLSTAVTDDLTSSSALQIDAKLKVNGDFDSTLCGSYCSSGTPIASSTTGIYELNAGSDKNYYYASTGFGGSVLLGSSATSFDDQRYSTSYNICVASAKFNDTIVIAGGVEGSDGIMYAYKANTGGTGYAGASGIITDGSYPHGGSIAPFTSAIVTVGIEHLGVQSTGKVLAAGYVRYLSLVDTGTFICRFKLNSLQLDSSFGTNGIIYLGATPSTNNHINTFYVAADNKVYVQYKDASTSNTYLKVFNADGTVYSAFGSTGSVATSSLAFSKIRIIDNRILCALKTNAANNLVSAYKLDGTADTTFGLSTSYLNLASRIPSSSNFNVSDISGNSSNEILLAANYLDGAGETIGAIIKLKKKLKPVPPAAVSSLYNTGLIVSPNPAGNFLKIQAGNNNNTLSVKITAINGAIIAQHTLVNNSTINIEQLAAGMYLLQVNNGTEVITTKFVKQ